MKIYALSENVVLVNGKYRVTRDGRIFTFWSNHGKWKEQKYRKHTNGYLRVTIDGRDEYLHRVIALCFCDNPNGYLEVNHIDGNKENNSADNLEWCTRSQNNKHAFATGLRDYAELKEMANSSAAIEARKKRRRLSYQQAEEIRKTSGKSDREIAQQYGVSRSAIWQIRKGVSYTHA